MDHVRIPILFESEVAFRKLVNGCAGRVPSVPSRMLATYLYVRIWIEMAMEARANNRPGFLTEASAELFVQRATEDRLPSLEWLRLLCDAGVLAKVDGGYECAAFNLKGLNAHCSGTFVKDQTRAAYRSAFNRQERKRNGEEQWLAMLLAEYRDKEGNQLSEAQRRGAISVINSLDNVLKQPSRGPTTAFWPEGLVVAAMEVHARYTSALKEVYMFILDNRGDSAIPKTTEQCVMSFAGLLKMMAERKQRGKPRMAEPADLSLL